MMLLLFIPIGITVNLAEKIDRILENEVPFNEVASFYFDFTIYFANLLFPGNLIFKSTRLCYR
jgi:lipopolysaccharide export system permease protein